MIKQQNKKNKTKKESMVTKKYQTFSTWYKTTCLRLLGQRLTKKKDYQSLSIKLRMADTTLTPAVYLSTILITTLLVFIISLPIYYILFFTFIQSQNWILYTLSLTGLTTLLTAAFMPLTISSKISTRKRQIEQDLPFILSELSILASTGLTPIKIFRHMATRTATDTVTKEFKKIIYKIDIEGKDIITAISESAKESPSQRFKETLWDIGNMIHQGGDLDMYLRQKADTTMDFIRGIQKEFIDKLGTYSEMYMSLVLTGTLFIAIAAFLIDAMQTTIMGIDANTLLLILAYFMIPIIIVVVNIIISLAYAKS